MALKGTKALEVWVKRVTASYPSVEITNMTSSWRNGLAFCAIIHHHCPDLIDFSSLHPDNLLLNNQLAFKVAEEKLGIPSLLDPKDMVECQVVDKLSVLTYLAQCYKAMHNPAALKLRLQTSQSSRSSNYDSINCNTTTSIIKSISMSPDKIANKPGSHLAMDRKTNTTPKLNTTPANPPNVNTTLANSPKVSTSRANLPNVNTTESSFHKVIITPANLFQVNTTSTDLLKLNTTVAKVNSTIAILPIVNKTTDNLPKTTITANLPKANTTTANLPRASTTTANLPKINTVADNLPKVNQFPDKLSSMLTKSAPNPSDLCQVCSLPVFLLERQGGSATLHRKCRANNVKVEPENVDIKQVLFSPISPRPSLTEPKIQNKAPPKPARTFQRKPEMFNTLDSSNNNTASSTFLSKGNRSLVPDRPRKISISSELRDLEIKITGLEKQGVHLEKKIRQIIENNVETEAIDPKEDELITQLFDLVNAKTETIRKKSEVIFLEREKLLEVKQIECDQQVRVLLDKDELDKTDFNKEEEARLIKQIIEIVQERNEIVNHLEMDRLREIEEDCALLDVRIHHASQY